MNNKLSFFLAILAVAVAFFAGFLCGKSGDSPQVVTRVEQVIVRDTIVAQMPVFRTKIIRDTILLAMSDTVRLHDTLMVALPREEVTYQDSTYRAVVSGYRPSLDYIEVYQNTVIRREPYEIKQRRSWAFGLTAGVGAVSPFKTFDPQLGYFIGLGVTKKF